jgi:peroxiredoxin
MSDSHGSLKAAFATLEAEREVSWLPEQLADNRNQRNALRARFDPALAVRVGDRLEDAALIDLDGVPFALGDLDSDLAVLIFFRFAACAADNLALPYYDRQLRPALDRLSVPIVALSPQIPKKLGEIVERHALGFRIVSDPDNGLARRLGIVFQPDTIPATPPADWIGATTGTETWELPMPTVLVIDRNRIVRFVVTSPDWLDRIEAPEIVAAVENARTVGHQKDFA